MFLYNVPHAARFSGFSAGATVTDTAPTRHVRIPGYEIRKEIGRGGVSTVYLAIQESLDREVALKIMSPALAAEPNFTERFIREGRTIAQLTHPGIVTIYDISVADYQHYIAMEYLPAGSLKQRMHKPIAPAPALAVLRQVAVALGYAHSKGFVHRDVKPENIIFRDPHTPVLTDFGIAKQTGGSDTHLTSVGVIVGTPRYMSPEQADGRGTDPRSDLYALGVLFYEMLVGRPPFDAKESIALLYSHINDPIPTLDMELQQLQPLINDLLAKEPENRIPDCQTLVERIRSLQRDVRGATRERALTPPEGHKSGDIKKSRTTTRLRTVRQHHGVWKIATWTGIALAATFIIAAVIRGFVEQQLGGGEQAEVVDESTPPAVATEPAAPRRAPALTKPKPIVTPEVVMPAAPKAGRSETLPAITSIQSNNDKVANEKPVPPAPASGPAPVASAPVRPPEPAPVTTRSEATGSRAAAGTRSMKKAPASRGWTVADEEKVTALLARAQEQLDAERLSHPPGDNALETYRTILQMAPGNPQAEAGLERVAQRYLSLANQALAQNKYQSSLAYIERGLSAVPGQVELEALKISVNKRKAAENDFASAEKYYYGKGVPKDLGRALEMYRSAADKGHVTAQYHLAVAYGNGVGVETNEREALRWLRVAAAQGNFGAQYNLSLGLIFGPSRDAQTAARWIKELANLNYEPAFRVLGWMYTTGTGVEHSIKESIRWTAKGVISKPVGAPERPDWVVTKWQRQFDAAYRRDVTKDYNEPS